MIDSESRYAEVLRREGIAGSPRWCVGPMPCSVSPRWVSRWRWPSSTTGSKSPAARMPDESVGTRLSDLCPGRQRGGPGRRLAVAILGRARALRAVPVRALAVGGGDRDRLCRNHGRAPAGAALGGAAAGPGLRGRRCARLLPCRRRAALVRRAQRLHRSAGCCYDGGRAEGAAVAAAAGALRRAGLVAVGDLARRLEPGRLDRHGRGLHCGFSAAAAGGPASAGASHERQRPASAARRSGIGGRDRAHLARRSRRRVWRHPHL